MTETGRVNDHDSDLALYHLPLFECCFCHSAKHDPVQLNCLHYYCRSCFHSSNIKTQVFSVSTRPLLSPLSLAHSPISLSLHSVRPLSLCSLLSVYSCGLVCLFPSLRFLPLICMALSPPKFTVTCPACSETTEISTLLTNSFLYTYNRASALHAEIVLCYTCEREEKEETAEFWCVVCAEALCYACYNRHNKFIPTPHRIFELEHARTLPLNQLTIPVQCNLHHLVMESHCFTCCLPKCSECLKSCSAGGHDVHLLSDEITEEHIRSTTNSVRDSAERLGSLLPDVLRKCRAIASRLRSLRTSGHRMLVRHRRRLHDSTACAFEESVAEICSGVHNRRYEHPGLLLKDFPRNCAANIGAFTVNGVQTLQLLRVRDLLQTVAAYFGLPDRSSKIGNMPQRSAESGSIVIHGSVSFTSEIVLRSCLGATARKPAAPRAPLLFRNKTSVSFKTTVACRDVATTPDGHVLLAAADHGLLVYSDRGQQLSSWRPERRSDGEDDVVYCVAALSDGRAAVGVRYAQLVVLLKLSEAGDTYLEDRRVAVLQSPPYSLAAHGDLLAAAEGRHERLVLGLWELGPELELLRLSSGQVLYTQRRGYDIRSVALTALCVVTTSDDPVQLSSGATARVLDAFSHSGQFLWRYVASDTETVAGVCASADGWSRLYVAVRRRDLSSSRVLEISGADGRDCREVLSSQTHGLPVLQIPYQLSLASGQKRTVLAVLSSVLEYSTEGFSWEDNRVSVYEAADQ